MVENIMFGIAMLFGILGIVAIKKNAYYVMKFSFFITCVVFLIQFANYLENERYIESRINTLAPAFVTYIDNHSDTTTSKLDDLIEDPNLKVVSFNISEQYGRQQYNIEIKCDKHIFPYIKKYTF